jgi:hypothetical protein
LSASTAEFFSGLGKTASKATMELPADRKRADLFQRLLVESDDDDARIVRALAAQQEAGIERAKFDIPQEGNGSGTASAYLHQEECPAAKQGDRQGDGDVPTLVPSLARDGHSRRQLSLLFPQLHSREAYPKTRPGQTARRYGKDPD